MRCGFALFALLLTGPDGRAATITAADTELAFVNNIWTDLVALNFYRQALDQGLLFQPQQFGATGSGVIDPALASSTLDAAFRIAGTSGSGTFSASTNQTVAAGKKIYTIDPKKSTFTGSFLIEKSYTASGSVTEYEQDGKTLVDINLKLTNKGDPNDVIQKDWKGLEKQTDKDGNPFIKGEKDGSKIEVRQTGEDDGVRHFTSSGEQPGPIPLGPATAIKNHLDLSPCESPCSFQVRVQGVPEPGSGALLAGALAAYLLARLRSTPNQDRGLMRTPLSGVDRPRTTHPPG